MAGFVGEAVLSGFIQKLVDMVTSPELWKYARKEQVDSELKRWKNILIKIYVVLNDAEEKRMTNPLVKIWLDELRDLGYDVEDILDDFATEALRSSLIMAQPQQGTSKVRGMLSSLIPSASTSNSSMRSKIEEITARLQDISAQKNDLDLREIAGGWWSDRKRKRAQILPTTSLVVESDVYGRETDKAAIVDMLLKHDPSSDDEVSVIPIVGMGGIGKTTLAQLAFNDDEVKGRFDLRAWVCVSDDFDVSRITKTILQSVDPGTHDVNDLNLLQVKLKEKFSGKKFLLVLDDVWNENSHEWDTLCMPMRAGAPGSKLIVTTRNEGVAAVTRTCPAYPLRELSNNDCLSLFTQQALRTRNFDAHPHLKEVGEEIVRRCKGLPLAAKALGGMLRNQLSRDAWANILTSRIWELPEDKSHILPALMLSYHHLPSHLKQCFAYCSMFPKDYEFDKDALVLLWIAEGFLQKTKEAARPEDLGSKYFDDLFSRSFFQHSSQDSSQYVMHDLTNDLARSVAGEIYFHLDSAWENNKQSTVSEKTRHSSFNRQEHETQRKFEPFHKVKCLRTLVALPMNPVYDCNFISKFPSWMKDPSFPIMTHLILKDCNRCTSLPALGQLSSLKVLHIKGMSKVRTINEEFYGGIVKPFPSLESLNFEVMAEWEYWFCPDAVNEGELFPCLRLLTIRDCRKLQQLPNCLPSQVKLDISCCPNLGFASSRFASLGEVSLEARDERVRISEVISGVVGGLHAVMRWSDWLVLLEERRLPCNLKMLRIQDDANLEKLPNGLQTLTCLEQLEIRRCPKLESFPETGLPPMLRSLKVIGCENLKWLPHNYNSCALEFLDITSCPSLRCFPNCELPTTLKSIWIEDCENLESLPEGMMHHDSTCCLEELKIKGCPRLESFPDTGLPPLLRRLVVSDCEGLKSLPHNYSSCALESLEIRYCSSLKSFSTRELPSTLKKLEICGCPDLESMSENMCPNNSALDNLVLEDNPNLKILPECLHSLKSLQIIDCDGLECFPAGGLSTPTLTSLLIEGCENLKSLPHQMRDLKSLRDLTIYICPGVESLPEDDMVSFPDEECLLPISLTSLTITAMESLAYLSLQNLISLRSLDVKCCPNLRSLGSMPATLEKLKIWGCPILEESLWVVEKKQKQKRIQPPVSYRRAMEKMNEGNLYMMKLKLAMVVEDSN
ncbi:putative disease resistance RPP13-like protein 1 [Vitis vinifera]|uniref:Putative disease resistance RPP13-like protein 1 n=1 Tax=Vitis vinifera TaxID=29760 RepID=A0A438CTQ1_VITVI|nr:putative disease resistance RPP13-like protein 1 [Vitis vinifera]